MEKLLVKKGYKKIKTDKPLVKRFYDSDKEIEDYILLRVPHYPYYSQVKVIKLYSTSNSKTMYRVNWWNNENILCDSQFVELLHDDEGNPQSINIK